jgi:hypothetical protein
MRRKPVDLSHVYAVDPDKGQEAFDKLPPELIDHLWAAFAHAAGIAPHPGFYDGPKPEVPEE